MFKKYARFMLSAYDKDTLWVRKKTRLLLIVNSIMIAMHFLNTFSVLAIARDITAVIVEAVTITVLFCAMILMKKKKFIMASNVTLVLLAVSSYILYAGSKSTAEFTMLQIAFFQLPIIIYSSLIGIRAYQSLLTSTMAFGFIIISFVTLLVKGQPLNSEIFNMLILSVLTIGISGTMTYLVIKNNAETVSIAEQETKINREKNKNIENVIQSSKKRMSVGEELVQFASRTLELTSGISQSLQSIRKETDFLSAIIHSTQVSNTTMLDSSKKVKTIIGEQNAAVNETSSSVEEITRSMEHIAASATSRKETIDRLVQTAKESKTEMDQSVRSIQEISRSSEDMINIIKVIQDVSSQTNVLAMNAAIEASHAGTSGKGFAIVASEIRKLSVETDRNSKLISSTLKKNVSDIEKASAINQRAGEYFSKLGAEVAEVKNAMEEIIVGMQEVSKGTGSILEAVTDILKTSGEVDGSMNEVDTRIADSNGNIRNIASFTSELKQKIDAMAKGFEDIIHITRLIDKAGRENTGNIEKLDKEIASIMK